MTIERKAKWIAGTLTGLFLLTLTASVYFYNTGLNYKSESDRARLSLDSVLAVKQLLDKELFDTRTELTNAKGHITELDAKLAESETKLAANQLLIDKLMVDNATVSALRKQLKSMKADRLTMEKQIQDLLAENQQLREQNAQLVKDLSQLEKDNLSLQDKLTYAQRSNAKAGNFRIDMLHTTSKVTAKAKRTNEIGINFDLPENLMTQAGETKMIYVVILDPNGNPVRNKSTKEVVLKDNSRIISVRSQNVDWSANPQTVAMTIMLDTKIKSKGVYKIEVFTEDGKIGAAQLRMN